MANASGKKFIHEEQAPLIKPREEAPFGIEPSKEFETPKEKQPEHQEPDAQTGEKTTPKRKLPIIRHAPPLPQTRDEITRKVEKIMEEGLHDVYQRLSPVARQEFKIKGEQTALKIRELLKSTHVKVKKIFRLIFDWLKMLPGINMFFLEQEAKIKADKIMLLKRD